MFRRRVGKEVVVTCFPTGTEFTTLGVDGLTVESVA
jgi:hypothetical protein